MVRPPESLVAETSPTRYDQVINATRYSHDVH